jgi:hypothetical protein
MSRRAVRTPAILFARPDDRGSADAGGIVRRRGVILRAGDYPNQDYEVTRARLRAMAENFTPVPIDHGHPSAGGPLDGAFGDLESVELSADGTTLYGTAAFHAWLEKKLGDARRLVSVTIDRATDRIRSLSLVTRPQIEDAELLAAFCACQAETDDTKVEGGVAVADEKFDKALEKLQEMDEAALAAFLEEKPAGPEPESGPKPEPKPTAELSADPQFAAVRKRLEEAEKKLAASHEAAKKVAAAAWAESEIRDGRSKVADFSARVEEYLQAAQDDDDLPRLVPFSSDGVVKTGTRVDALKARHLARPAKSFGDRIPIRDGDEPANFSLGEKGESDREYAKRIVAKYNGRNRIAGAASRNET